MDTTSSRSPLVSSVPAEIVELILNNLDLPSLAACVRIDKAWSELSTPHLWRTLNIDNGERLERFMTEATLTALTRNARYIQELTLKYMNIYTIFAPAVDGSGSTHAATSVVASQCTNLRRLDLLLHEDPKRKPDGEWEYDDPWEFLDKPFDSVLDKAVVSLIRRNPALTVLVIEKLTCFKTLLPLVVHDLSNLEELHCSMDCTTDERLAKVLLEHLPERIRSVHICVSTPDIASQDSTADGLPAELQIQEPRQHHALEVLVVAGNFNAAEEYLFLLPFLDTCRKPMTFRIFGNKWVEEPRIKEAFSRLGFFLENLEPSDLQHGYASSDAEIAEYIHFSNHWKAIHLPDCRSAGRLTAAAILDNCDRLESINLACCSLVSSSEIQLILGKATLLETFVALNYHSRDDANDPFISAADFIALEWGSRSLVKFNCKIEVPRSTYDAVEEQEGSSRALDAIAASRAIQRQVYQRLAEQKSLKVLQLGHHPSQIQILNERWFQRHCLEMTLDSGLDELFSLWELAMLNVCAMAHQIGVLELEWMNRNWPDLDRLCGMFVNCVDPVPGAREWIRHTSPDWVHSSELVWFENLSQ
ncbi:hypothetical protein BGZ81_001692 [Podila clonocystis]|nr:hypothetical protein BGZ81_001692 [Podila clonocystis]